MTRRKILIDLDSYFKDVTNIKLPAYLFIDDRNIKFNGNYSKTLTEIKLLRLIGSNKKV